SPNGRLLAVGNRNSVTCLFDVATGALRQILPRVSSHGLQFDPTGKTLAVVYVDSRLALWNVADGDLIRVRRTQAEELYDVDWSPDGSMLATSGRNAKITIWDPRDLSILHELPAPEWVIGVRFSPDGLCLINAGGIGSVGGKRRLEVQGIEGALYSLLNRPRP